jgi:GNAT superfamily N-acetyltransferase
MSISMRYAIAEDSELLGAIYTEAYSSAYRDFIPKGYLAKVTPQGMRDSFHKIIIKNPNRVALIYKDNEAVGLACIGKYRKKDLDDTWGEIMRIYLLPSFTGKGIGTEVMNWCLNELKALGYKKICLWVFEKNIKGRKFYEKFGFSADGKIRNVILGGKTLKVYRYIKLLKL